MGNNRFTLVIELFSFEWTSDTIDPEKLPELSLEESYECYDEEPLGDYVISLSEEEANHLSEVMKRYQSARPNPIRGKIYYSLIGFIPKIGDSYITYYSYMDYTELKNIATEALVQFNKKQNK